MDYDQRTAECLVFTYKDGLLSRVGHDLKLRCDRFQIHLDPERIEATFDASAFSVVGAVRDGRVQPGTLSSKDQKQILENMRKSVLKPDRSPEIHFVSTAVQADTRDLKAEGTLTLNGVSRPLSVKARKVDGKWLTDVELHTPDYGIAPFTALLGALKVKPGVKVRLLVPAD